MDKLGRQNKTKQSKTQEDSITGARFTLCAFYLQELYQVLTVKIREKYLWAFRRGRQKVSILKHTSAF